MERVSRRDLGRWIAAGAIAISPLRTVAQPPSGPARKDVTSLAPDAPDLVNYRKAVGLMQKLPTSDRRSWKKQWEIHTSFCPHRNWWFLPWHRAYLHYFELCCRDLLQTGDFALPYWDWTGNPRMPAAFQDGILNHPGRRLQGNMQIPDEFVGRRVVNGLLRGSVLLVFFSGPTRSDNQQERAEEGTLEATPHDNVHAQVGGDMGSVPTSPNDPIFWLHHCNLDRIWASWAALHGNASFPQDLWRNHILTSFYDPVQKKDAQPVTSETVNAAEFGSVYDRLETLGPNFPLISVVNSSLAGAAAAPTIAPASASIGQPVKLWAARKTQVALSSDMAAFAEEVATRPSDPSDVLLFVEGVEPPSSPTVSLRVLLNSPNPGPNVPVDDPSFVGTVGFFPGHDHAGESRARTFVFGLEDRLRALRQAGRYTDPSRVDVSLVPVDTTRPIGSAGPTITASRVRLVALE